MIDWLIVLFGAGIGAAGGLVVARVRAGRRRTGGRRVTQEPYDLVATLPPALPHSIEAQMTEHLADPGRNDRRRSDPADGGHDRAGQ